MNTQRNYWETLFFFLMTSAVLHQFLYLCTSCSLYLLTKRSSAADLLSNLVRQSGICKFNFTKPSLAPSLSDHLYGEVSRPGKYLHQATPFLPSFRRWNVVSSIRLLRSIACRLLDLLIALSPAAIPRVGVTGCFSRSKKASKGHT